MNSVPVYTGRHVVTYVRGDRVEFIVWGELRRGKITDIFGHDGSPMVTVAAEDGRCYNVNPDYVRSAYATENRDGAARPVATPAAPEPDAYIWFVTDLASPEYREWLAEKTFVLNGFRPGTVSVTIDYDRPRHGFVVKVARVPA